MTEKKAARSPLVLHLVLLLALCGVLYFPYLGNTPLFDKGEPREALAVQDIVQRGEWLYPLKRATAIPSKPPLFHWTAALAYQFSGQLNEATIRFPSALYATLGVVLVYLLGRKLFGAEVGLLAGAILATTMIYQNQALSARVDMTLCFFVTASLGLFYALYRGLLQHPLWNFAFYALVGLGTLAKGPLGLLLPGVVIVAFLAVKRRWDWVAKLALHPGVLITLLLVVGWYALAITRGGEGFVDRQLLSENLGRFFGGSGHSHPIYYYLPYLFSLGLPWSLFLPFMFWDWFCRGAVQNDDRLFLKLWFIVVFVFFSLSAGKRPVYLLPLFPPLALLSALWIYDPKTRISGQLLIYRSIAVFAGLVGAVLLVVTIGSLWNHQAGWFFSPIATLLKPKDRANLALVQDALDDFGSVFTAIACLGAGLWLLLSWSLWLGRLRGAALIIVLNAIPFMFIGRGMLLPVIADAKSYRDFMGQVNQKVKPDDKLSIYGEFNSDPVIFYRGSSLEVDDRPLAAIAAKPSTGNSFVIMTEQDFQELYRMHAGLPEPLLRSSGKGPEGDAPLVLLQVEIS